MVCDMLNYVHVLCISQIPNNPLQSFTDGKLVSTVPMMIVSEGNTLEFSMMTPAMYSSPCPRWMQGTVAEEAVFIIYEAIKSSLSVSWVILASPYAGDGEYHEVECQEIWPCAYLYCPCVQALEYDALVAALFPFHFISVLKEYPPSNSSSDQRPLAAVSAYLGWHVPDPVVPLRKCISFKMLIHFCGVAQ